MAVVMRDRIEDASGIRNFPAVGGYSPKAVAPVRYDCQVFDGADAEEFFEAGSVRWYRRMLEDPAAEQKSDDLDFLRGEGFVVRRGGCWLPTQAAVLVFGRLPYVRQMLPRPLVDLQFIVSNSDALYPEQRWFDRFVAEENLLRTWTGLMGRYMRHSDRPFRLDPVTFRRNDEPPDYTAFREAAMNLLLHQNYEDHGLKATIQVFRDRIVFRNPDAALVSAEESAALAEGDERNPALAEAFRRIGLSRRAGSGLRRIFDNWLQLGYVSPVITSDKARRAFELRLPREKRESLGDHHRRLLDLCEIPRSSLELMQSVGMAHRTFFRRRHLKPLLDAELICMTNPERPRAANQRYVLTASGREFRAMGWDETKGRA